MEMRSRAVDRVRTFLWKLRPEKNDEKIPFAHNSARRSSGAIYQVLAAPGNGQIAKEMAMDSNKKCQTDPGTPPLMLEEEDKGPMSISRKACFLLSFNSWILYVAAIFWFVPCSFNNLPGSLKWDKTFSNMELTTELETTGQLVIFGCNNTRTNDISQSWGSLIALNSAKGDIAWTKSLNFIPFQVYCRDIASRETPVCTVIGENEIMLLDSLNGDQLWNQTLGSDFVNQENSSIILCDSSKIPMAIKNVLIDNVANQYKILNIDTSKQIIGLNSIDFPIDCDELLLKSDSIILDKSNKNNMVFICRHPQSIDLWTVPEKVLCEGEGEGNGTIVEKFHHLYRINNDRVPLPDGILIADVKKRGLIIGWSNVATLLSKDTPYSQIWKHLFKSSSVVVSIIPGRFTSIKEDEIAVTIQDESRGAVVHVLSLLDGKVLVSMPVGDRQIRSVSLIPGQQLAGTDRLLIQMGTNNFTSMPLPSQSGEISKFIGKDRLDESNSFYEVNLRKQKLTSRLVTTSSALESKVITNQVGDVNLVVTEQLHDAKLTIRDIVLKSNLQSGCSLA